MSAPLVGITACTKASGALPAQTVSLKYVDDIAQGSEAVPVMIPALGAALDIDSLLDRLDGFFEGVISPLFCKIRRGCATRWS